MKEQDIPPGNSKIENQYHPFVLDSGALDLITNFESNSDCDFRALVT